MFVTPNICRLAAILCHSLSAFISSELWLVLVGARTDLTFSGKTLGTSGRSLVFSYVLSLFSFAAHLFKETDFFTWHVVFLVDGFLNVVFSFTVFFLFLPLHLVIFNHVLVLTNVCLTPSSSEMEEEAEELEAGKAVYYTWTKPTGSRELSWKCGKYSGKLKSEEVLYDLLLNYHIKDQVIFFLQTFFRTIHWLQNKIGIL